MSLKEKNEIQVQRAAFKAYQSIVKVKQWWYEKQGNFSLSFPPEQFNQYLFLMDTQFHKDSYTKRE